MKIVPTTDAEIIEFFRRHEIEFEIDERNQRVQTVADCHQALRDQLGWAICDPKAIIRGEAEDNPDGDPDELLAGYLAALRDPKAADRRGDAWFITYHLAAALLDTTVEAVVDEIDPQCFSDLRRDEQNDYEVIELFRENFVLGIEDGKPLRPRTVADCLGILQARAAGISKLLAVSVDGSHR